MAVDGLSSRFRVAHNEMRNADGLQPQEAFDELLKYLFFKEHDEGSGDQVAVTTRIDAHAAHNIAAEVRNRFRQYAGRSSVAPKEWESSGFRLSDLALVRVHAAFANIWLLGLGVDVRSAALKTYLTGSVRKGLGIFLTPDAVVREIVRALDPKPGNRVLDLACGSGTFLVEAAAHCLKRHGSGGLHLFGVDKSARMALMCELNCSHVGAGSFACSVADSLSPYGDELPTWLQHESFDLVLTNPPFGVTNNAVAYQFEDFATCSDERGALLRAQDSEIMFLERALSLLKPGGKLGIVLPRSVVTNQRYEVARQRLGRVGAIRAVITLPPETFAATGAQTTTTVLIIEKFGPALKSSDWIEPILAKIDNVGFDHTGRSRDGSQLEGLGDKLRNALATSAGDRPVQLLTPMAAGKTLVEVAGLVTGRPALLQPDQLHLHDLVEIASTGTTPPRASYAAEGLFLVKVGNLTGAGIDWYPRERNFVKDVSRILKGGRLDRLLRRGDILLTSSAHSAKYIARKVDVVTSIPDEVGGRASFVGEAMLLRPRVGVDPFRLVAYLRMERVIESIQDRVRGQTAHLHPRDLLDLPIDKSVYDSGAIGRLAELIQEECFLSERANQIAFKQAAILDTLGEQSDLLETVA